MSSPAQSATRRKSLQKYAKRKFYHPLLESPQVDRGAATTAVPPLQERDTNAGATRSKHAQLPPSGYDKSTFVVEILSKTWPNEMNPLSLIREKDEDFLAGFESTLTKMEAAMKNNLSQHQRSDEKKNRSGNHFGIYCLPFFSEITKLQLDLGFLHPLLSSRTI